MNAENKFARIMRNTGPARFFIPVGIILIVFGVLMLGFKTDNFIETTGKITAVTECPKEADENQQYDVEFTYTANGKEYENSFPNMEGSYTVGDDITIYYDPADPEKITNSKMGFLPLIIIVAGAAAIVFGVYKTVNAFKKSQELDNAIPGGAYASDAEFEMLKTASGTNEYYCKFDGQTFKPGYIIEDANRKVLFEAKMTKQALVGARTFEFNNHITGSVKEHQVGHTTTQNYNDEFFSATSWFKFDGENIWNLLHSRGIRIKTNMRSKFPNLVYEVSKDGNPFTVIETSGKYVHEDEAAEHKINIPVGRYYYRFWTQSSDMESLFLTIFAISETEQTVVE